jgi:hypothetical protein
VQDGERPTLLRLSFIDTGGERIESTGQNNSTDEQVGLSKLAQDDLAREGGAAVLVYRYDFD